MAPTVRMHADWTPVSTSQRAPGSWVPLVVTPATVPAITLASTVKKSKAQFYTFVWPFCIRMHVICTCSLALFLVSFWNIRDGFQVCQCSVVIVLLCLISQQINESKLITCVPVGLTCRAPEVGGVIRPAAPVTVRRTRASILIVTRPAESVAARWVSRPAAHQTGECVGEWRMWTITTQQRLPTCL